MDPAYVIWIIVGSLGAALGLVLKPRTIAITSGILFGAALIGLVLSTDEKQGFLFGMAAMVIPIFGVLTTMGAALTRLLRGRSRQSSNEGE